MSGPKDEGELGHGAQLLAAIRTAIGDDQTIATAELVEKINGEEELPFGVR